ncbi:MAG: hypothetical protein ACXVWU_03630 [Nocardioides sp.]
MTRSLNVSACRRLCTWSAEERQLDGEPLFSCSGCGSEWVPSQTWTPIDWQGEIPAAVQAARRERGRG